MTPVNPNYPVFEADQVLSQKHLNKLISYLEKQDRISRVQLLGMGIICGLEINKPNTTTIAVSCGTAVTSLGYLISFEESEFTFYRDAVIAENFLNPDTEKHPYLESIFMGTEQYNLFEHSFELLKEETIDRNKKKLTKAVLKDKVILLLLEASLIDEKNCVAVDCADKGKRLEFKIRPLLIDKKLIEASDILVTSCITNYFDSIPLSKYNVPGTNLVTSKNVLDAFNAQIKEIKQKISDGVKKVHDQYLNVFNDLPNYSNLSNISNKINDVHAENEDDIHIQYVWDWLSDIVAAYHEIAIFNTCNPSVCCPNPQQFPFHVLLGVTEFPTQKMSVENELRRFRTSFIKTGILAEETNNKKIELKGLLEKLIYLIQSFNLNLEAVSKNGIKITPSLLGSAPLSQRAIPFYYDKIKKLNKKWSPELTLKRKNQHILSYHSQIYNDQDDHINNPLAYDLEAYNFFRIEGHIGKRYEAVLTTIISQTNRNRLPFKVIALNASSYAKRDVDISKHLGDWNDIELDYDMARKKVYNITEHVIKWITSNKPKLIQKKLMQEQVINDLSDILTQSRSLLTENLQEFIPQYDGFHKVFKELNDLFLIHRFCILAAVAAGGVLSTLAEDLIDHFDEINSLFLEDPFTVIVEEAQRRWDTHYKDIFLSKFLEKHPGIEHKAGVPKGGTLILVYSDSSVFTKPKSKDSSSAGLIRRIKGYKKSFSYTAKEIEDITVVNTLAVSKRKKPLNIILGDGQFEEMERVKKVFLENSKSNLPSHLPFAVRDFMFDNLTRVFERDFSNDTIDTGIPEKVIIADFYLPYICCSNGTTINIVLPGDTEEVVIEVEEEEKTADFGSKDFNSKDFLTNA